MESTQWALKAVTLMPYGVPDSTKAYSIKLRAKTDTCQKNFGEEGGFLPKMDSIEYLG